VVVEQSGPVEIRRYEPRIAAETVVQGDPEDARNEGFRRIAGYIFGGNERQDSIAMTSPVTQSPSQQIAMTSPVAQTPSREGWKVQFFMPSKYRINQLPAPKDPTVRLVELPAQTYAVLRFTGSRGTKAVDRKQSELMTQLKAQGRGHVGEPVAWFYDPPWTIPMARRNEVAVEISSAGQAVAGERGPT